MSEEFAECFDGIRAGGEDGGEGFFFDFDGEAVFGSRDGGGSFFAGEHGVFADAGIRAEGGDAGLRAGGFDKDIGMATDEDKHRAGGVVLADDIFAFAEADDEGVLDNCFELYGGEGRGEDGFFQAMADLVAVFGRTRRDGENDFVVERVRDGDVVAAEGIPEAGADVTSRFVVKGVVGDPVIELVSDAPIGEVDEEDGGGGVFENPGAIEGGLGKDGLDEGGRRIVFYPDFQATGVGACGVVKVDDRLFGDATVRDIDANIREGDEACRAPVDFVNFRVVAIDEEPIADSELAAEVDGKAAEDIAEGVLEGETENDTGDTSTGEETRDFFVVNELEDEENGGDDDGDGDELAEEFWDLRAFAFGEELVEEEVSDQADREKSGAEDESGDEVFLAREFDLGEEGGQVERGEEGEELIDPSERNEEESFEKATRGEKQEVEGEGADGVKTDAAVGFEE